MTLALGRTVFLDGERRPDDYIVVHDGQTVGRTYRMRSTGPGGTQIGWGSSHGHYGGVGDSLDDAKAGFRAA
jgi:hypothetical protein